MQTADKLHSVQEKSLSIGSKDRAHSMVAKLETVSVRFNQVLAVIAGLAMVFIALLIVANAIIRIYYVPIPGVGEISGWLSAITVAFALGYTQIHRGHVDMDILVNKFPSSVRRVIHGFMLLVSMLFFALISYRLFIYANQIRLDGTLSETLAVIFYPYVYLLAVGFVGLTLALLTDTIKIMIEGDRP